MNVQISLQYENGEKKALPVLYCIMG